jgi:hypothetical protein
MNKMSPRPVFEASAKGVGKSGDAINGLGRTKPPPPTPVNISDQLRSRAA